MKVKTLCLDKVLDYGLVKHTNYFVLGSVLIDNQLYHYIFDDWIRLLPANIFTWVDYFGIDKYIFYYDYNQNGVGVTFEKINNIKYWYEKYLDGDESTLEIVNSILSFYSE